MAIFVSQSGETADTLAALRHVKDKVAKVVSVVNVPTSSIARESDLALPILAGVEVGVASTKAFTCQLTVLALMALKAAQDRGVLDAPSRAAHLAEPARPARPDERTPWPCRTRSRASPKNWPRRRISCSSAAARCSRWRWKAR